jgi:hypothetical protein
MAGPAADGESWTLPAANNFRCGGVSGELLPAFGEPFPYSVGNAIINPYDGRYRYVSCSRVTHCTHLCSFNFGSVHTG